MVGSQSVTWIRSFETRPGFLKRGLCMNPVPLTPPTMRYQKNIVIQRFL